MNLAQLEQRQRRLAKAQADSAARGEKRHHLIDDKFAQIDRNMERIAALEAQIAVLEIVVATHQADIKKHTGK